MQAAFLGNWFVGGGVSGQTWKFVFRPDFCNERGCKTDVPANQVLFFVRLPMIPIHMWQIHVIYM